ncbi:ABC-2 family transporter protein [Thalassoglobus neptunius]|uniref:ABC-2 family transporter protein n=1 Tax=Thalassoglobus neptunius TaxID=1938619 RepID=A0A5C5WGV7_9PLAN|nr:ABC transporter permease subunit [Thalassoglobus neptunius]TWT50016.1 ABC-2 family transporter protein [Thalassoglobus neptunius]
MNRILALVKRALQTDARQLRGHVIRFLLGAFILWMLFVYQATAGLSTAPGLDLFRSVMVCNYLAITIAGTAFFSSAITEEKEERTLGLLRMAGVGSTSLILGKWIPRLICAALLLSVQIPFNFLSVTLGGVLWQQVVACYLTLFAHLYLVGNLGLLASVLMSSTASACGLAFGILIALFILPMLLSVLAMETSGFISQAASGLANAIQSGSAQSQISEILATGANPAMWNFQIISNLIVGTVFLITSWLFFDVFTRNEKEPGSIGLFDRLRRRRNMTRRRRIGSYPIIWKDFQFIGGGRIFILLKFGIYFGLAVAITFFSLRTNRDIAEMLGGVLFGYSIFFLFIELAIVSARVFRYELQEKTWSTLVMLPRSIREIAYAKVLGGLTTTLPLFACMFLGIILLGEDFWEGLGSLMQEFEALLVITYLLLQYLLGLHLSTFCSIVAKWGVWPVAISMAAFIMIASNMVVISFFALAGASDGWEALVVIGCMITGGITLALHHMIGDRLQAKAAES